MTSIRLLKAHEHAGHLLSSGSTLAVDDATAAWLIEQGIAEQIPAGTALKAAPAAARERKGRTCCGW